MPHPLKGYVPSVDEYVILRQAFTDILVQVTCVGPRKAEMFYLTKDKKGNPLEVRKTVPFSMLKGAPHDHLYR